MFPIRKLFRSAFLIPSLALAVAIPLSSAQANKERILYRFTGVDGYSPFAGLVRDDAGNLYGTTQSGGSGGCGLGCGVVFKVTPVGIGTVLHSFTGGSDGAAPLGDLIRNAETGDLLGTTYQGGDQHCNCGTIFKLAPDGTETVLHTFSGRTDGGWPAARLVRDSENNIYGTASIDGVNHLGTVFKLAPGGTFTVLHSFMGRDGACPESRLKWDQLGNLFGTTEDNCTGGLGTIFKLAHDGSFSTLYAFTGGANGSNPYAGLATDTFGNLYGTARNGGDLDCGFGAGCGVVFKLAPDGAETVLHAFTLGNDGGDPVAGLHKGRSGNFYGTTQRGGRHGHGTVFEITPTGKISTLYSFKGGQDGAGPVSHLIEDKKGNLYGTTAGGGGSVNCTSGCGVVFTVKE